MPLPPHGLRFSETIRTNPENFSQSVGTLLPECPVRFRQTPRCSDKDVPTFRPFHKTPERGMHGSLPEDAFCFTPNDALARQRKPDFHNVMTAGGRISRQCAQSLNPSRRANPATKESSRSPRHSSFGPKVSGFLSDTMNRRFPECSRQKGCTTKPNAPAFPANRPALRDGRRKPAGRMLLPEAANGHSTTRTEASRNNRNSVPPDYLNGCRSGKPRSWPRLHCSRPTDENIRGRK